MSDKKIILLAQANKLSDRGWTSHERTIRLTP